VQFWNADSDEVIDEFDPSDDDTSCPVFYRQAHEWSIGVDPLCDHVDFGPYDLVLKKDGKVLERQHENKAPYVIYGNKSGNIYGKDMETGHFVLSATGYGRDYDNPPPPYTHEDWFDVEFSFEVQDADFLKGFSCS